MDASVLYCISRFVYVDAPVMVAVLLVLHCGAAYHQGEFQALSVVVRGETCPPRRDEEE